MDYKINLNLKKIVSVQLSKKQFEKAYETICAALQSDISNVYLLELLEKEYKKVKLYNELVEIYKMCFMYSLKPKYFEKIADMYFRMKEYDKALENYLNFAENSKPRVCIYKKLARVFEKLNDIESATMCLNQAALLRNAND